MLPLPLLCLLLLVLVRGCLACGITVRIVTVASVLVKILGACLPPSLGLWNGLACFVNNFQYLALS